MKRYKTGGYGAMVEDDGGTWVRYADAAQRIETLTAERDAAETRAREAEALTWEEAAAYVEGCREGGNMERVTQVYDVIGKQMRKWADAARAAEGRR